MICFRLWWLVERAREGCVGERVRRASMMPPRAAPPTGRARARGRERERNSKHQRKRARQPREGRARCGGVHMWVRGVGRGKCGGGGVCVLFCLRARRKPCERASAAAGAAGARKSKKRERVKQQQSRGIRREKKSRNLHPMLIFFVFFRPTWPWREGPGARPRCRCPRPRCCWPPSSRAGQSC